MLAKNVQRVHVITRRHVVAVVNRIYAGRWGKGAGRLVRRIWFRRHVASGAVGIGEEWSEPYSFSVGERPYNSALLAYTEVWRYEWKTVPEQSTV